MFSVHELKVQNQFRINYICENIELIVSKVRISEAFIQNVNNVFYE